MNRLSMFIVFILCSCSSVNKLQSYYFIEAFKEQEIILQFKEDSTFSFIDKIGCNQFELRGKYREVLKDSASYFIVDSIRLENVLSNYNFEMIFPLKNGDTAWTINKDRISINHQPFKKMAKANINLQEIRYQKLKDYYTELLGKEGFLQTFGNGSKRQVKKKLLDCNLPDMKLK